MNHISNTNFNNNYKLNDISTNSIKNRISSNEIIFSIDNKIKIDARKSLINQIVVKNTEPYKLKFASNLNEELRTICEQAYTEASRQIAEETWAIAPKLDEILNQADRVRMLNFPYVRSTVFQVLRLVDGGQYPEAEEYMKKRSLGCRNTPGYREALATVNLSIQLLIQWKRDFEKWKNRIQENVKSVLANIEKNLSAYSVTKDQKEAEFHQMTTTLHQFAEELCAHLSRDIGKTARGLIGIVKITPSHDAPEIKPLQLIINLSANCSMRKQMSPDTEFQRYLSGLKKISPFSEIIPNSKKPDFIDIIKFPGDSIKGIQTSAQLRIETQNLLQEHKEKIATASTAEEKKDIKNEFRAKFHHLLQLPASEWATLNLDYVGADGRPYKHDEINTLVDELIADLIISLENDPRTVHWSPLRSLTNDYTSSRTLDITNSLQNAQSILGKINSLEGLLGENSKWKSTLLTIRYGLETAINWLTPAKQSGMLIMQKHHQEQLDFFRSIVRNTFIPKDEQNWKVSDLPDTYYTDRKNQYFNMSSSEDKFYEHFEPGTRLLGAVHEFAHVIDRKPAIFNQVKDYLDKHCKKESSNEKIYTCDWIKFITHIPSLTHVTPYGAEAGEDPLHLIPAIFEKLFDDPLEFFDTIPSELANLVWLVIDLVGERTKPAFS